MLSKTPVEPKVTPVCSTFYRSKYRCKLDQQRKLNCVRNTWLWCVPSSCQARCSRLCCCDRVPQQVLRGMYIDLHCSAAPLKHPVCPWASVLLHVRAVIHACSRSRSVTTPTITPVHATVNLIVGDTEAHSARYSPFQQTSSACDRCVRAAVSDLTSESTAALDPADVLQVLGRPWFAIVPTDSPHWQRRRPHSSTVSSPEGQALVKLDSAGVTPTTADVSLCGTSRCLDQISKASS
jgi:hypothetical protein